MVLSRVSRHPYHPPRARPTEEWPSVRLAHVRALRAAERAREIRERLAAIPTLNLEPRLHAELLAEMASIIDGGWREE